MPFSLQLLKRVKVILDDNADIAAMSDIDAANEINTRAANEIQVISAAALRSWAMSSGRARKIRAKMEDAGATDEQRAAAEVISKMFEFESGELNPDDPDHTAAITTLRTSGALSAADVTNLRNRATKQQTLAQKENVAGIGSNHVRLARTVT